MRWSGSERVRYFAGQINYDGVPSATLTLWQTWLDQQINNRLNGNGIATTGTEELFIKGLALKAIPLEELQLFRQDVANALQKLQPGSTVFQAFFPGCGGGPGSSYDPDHYRRW